MNGSKLLTYGAKGAGPQMEWDCVSRYPPDKGLGKEGGIIKIVCFGNVVLKRGASITANGAHAGRSGG